VVRTSHRCLGYCTTREGSDDGTIIRVQRVQRPERACASAAADAETRTAPLHLQSTSRRLRATPAVCGWLLYALLENRTPIDFVHEGDLSPDTVRKYVADTRQLLLFVNRRELHLFALGVHTCPGDCDGLAVCGNHGFALTYRLAAFHTRQLAGPLVDLFDGRHVRHG
jgi:hypothetical protein